MAKATMYFPHDFKWAAATAAHQVEGNNTNNDWWAWEQTGEHVRNGQKSGLACDWWGAGFDRDMDFAAQMNHNGHRMSIEWSRIEPREGQWDAAAIDRYRDLKAHHASEYEFGEDELNGLGYALLRTKKTDEAVKQFVTDFQKWMQ